MRKRSLFPWNQPHFLKNSDKSHFWSKAIEKKSETRFCRRKTAEDDNAKINVSPNIPCTFLLFKTSALPQVFFPRKSKFWERQFFSIANDWHSFYLLTFIPLIELRARLHETRSELTPVWDFTSGWYFISVQGNFIISVHMTSGEMKLMMLPKHVHIDQGVIIMITPCIDRN